MHVLIAWVCWVGIHYMGLDNLSGPWYGFWSGFGSDLPIFAGIAIFLIHRNCHKKGCWRLMRKAHEDGNTYCMKHHRQAECP